MCNKYNKGRDEGVASNSERSEKKKRRKKKKKKERKEKKSAGHDGQRKHAAIVQYHSQCMQMSMLVLAPESGRASAWKSRVRRSKHCRNERSKSMGARIGLSGKDIDIPSSAVDLVRCAMKCASVALVQPSQVSKACQKINKNPPSELRTRLKCET